MFKITYIKDMLIGGLKYLRSRSHFWFKQHYSSGTGLHIGRKSYMLAPDFVHIKNNAYIGKEVMIECNLKLGSNGMIANRVSFIGRKDHDFRQIGVPIRFSRNLQTMDKSLRIKEFIDIGDDVWIGAGAIILSPLTIGDGAIVAAGAVVTKNVKPYTIVGGNPAIELGNRFSDNLQNEHINMINKQKFSYDFKGLSYSKTGGGS